ARFGGNEESKKMRKTMLKQAFSEFSMSEEEGLHKGYDRFQKILSQLNQMQAKPDNDDVDQLEMEELDIKWKMAMLSLRINKFQKKAGGKINFNNKDSARFDRRKERCYNCLQLGHFTRECNVKKVDEKARYSAFKISKVKTEEPKAMVSVDSMLNWNEHDAENKTEEAKQVYGLMAGFESNFVVHAGNVAGGVNPAPAEFAMMGISPKLAIEEKVRILSANLENITNTLKYSETLYAHAKIEKQEWKIKFVESLARFDKWQESSKNLAKLLYSSMSTRTKLGLEFKEYIGSDEVCDLSTPSVFDPEPGNREVKSLYERFVKAGNMHEVSPPIIGTFMPTSYQSDLAETQVTFGSKSYTSSIPTSESNDFVSCDTNDKSSASETYDFASCVSSPKTNDSFSTVDVKLLLKSDIKDPSLTNGLPSCSFKENVKPPRNLCNKSGTADRIPCKNTFVRTKKCFVCGSKSHLIEDCNVHDTVDNFPSVVSKAAFVPAGSRNSSASISASRSIPAASKNRSASIHAGRSIPAASRNKPASIHAGKHIPAGRINKPAPFLPGSSVPTDLICNGVPRTMVDLINLHGFKLNDPQGRLKSMIGNKDKLDDFVQVKSGTVTFGGGDGKITGKGTIRTSKLNFENVYYVEELQNFNLFSVSQICDKKNKVLFTDDECLVLTKEFQLPYESQVVLRIPRRHDLYTFNLSDIQPEQHINCLLAKASLEEYTKWHRRMARVNFKTINKLAKHGLVEGLPLKLFTNEHNCVVHPHVNKDIGIIDSGCFRSMIGNKGKQHKASYKAIFAVRTISEPLQLLHMDLFGPTSIRSIDHKYYSLVVTDDFSRFCWAFFLGTKDETFYILKDFIALIENQLNKKIKAIRCNNGTEFRNAKLIALCEEKGIKKDYSNARTPQQNGVAERKNQTLIEAARSMLADSKLPIMFWTEAVSTACYVLNRVSITNPHNKTPYELLSGKGKLMTVFLLGMLLMAYRVYNLSSKKVEETLNLRYLEDKPNVQGLGQEWYFDLDYLTDSLGYKRFKTNPPACTHDTNILVGTQADDSESEYDEQIILVHSFPSNSFSGPTVHDVSAPMENNLDYAEELARLQRQEYEAHSAAVKHGFEFFDDTAALLHQAAIDTRRILVPAEGDPAGSIVSTGGVPAGIVPASGVPAGSVPASSVPAGGVLAGSIVSTGGVPASSIPGSSVPTGGVLTGSIISAEFGDPAASASVPAVLANAPAATFPLPPGHSLGSCEHTTRFSSPSDLGNHQPTAGIFFSSSYDADFCADVTNLASTVAVVLVATKRVNTIYPQSQIIGELQSPVQTKSTVQKSKFGENAFISYIAIGTKWILKNKRDARGIVVHNKARLVAQSHRQEAGIDYDEVFAPDSDIHQLIEECSIKVPKEQKQKMKDTMFELVKICQEKRFLCIHDDIDNLIESTLDSKLLSINSINSQRLDKKDQEVKNVEEQPAGRRNRAEKSLQNFRVVHKSSISFKNTSQISSIHLIAQIQSTKEPKHLLSMGYEHLSITPETESDKVTEYNVENLLPIPSKREVTLEDEIECDMPAKDVCSLVFTTFSNPLFKDNDDLDSSDDESLFDEDVPAEEFKIYSNPLCDEDKINYDKLDPHHFNVESDFIESLLNRDTFIDFSSKFDFSGELAHIKPEIPKSDFDFEEEIRLIENLLYDNSFPRPPKELNAEIAYTIIDDDNDDDLSNDFLLGESDLFLFDDSIPLGIDDPEGDIHFLEELLIDDSILSHESSDSNFEDNPSISRPPPEPPDDNFDLETEFCESPIEIVIFQLLSPRTTEFRDRVELTTRIILERLKLSCVGIFVRFLRSSYPFIDSSLGKSISF
nr:putative ribonuclease H-like domain-containing protein [Tanacetum cinerariifolium]